MLIYSDLNIENLVALYFDILDKKLTFLIYIKPLKMAKK